MFTEYLFESNSKDGQARIDKYLSKAFNSTLKLSNILINEETVKVLDREQTLVYLKRKNFDDISFDLCEELFIYDLVKYIHDEPKVFFTIWEWNYLFIKYIDFISPEIFEIRLGSSDYIKVEELLNSDFYKYL